MMFAVGVVFLGVIVYFIYLKQAVSNFNKLCLVGFDEWLSIYKLCKVPEKVGMSRAFFLQTLHIAENFKVLTKSDRNAMETEMRKMDPSAILDEWLSVALPKIVKIYGSTAGVDARTVGLYMLICVMGINPESDLRRFLERLK